MKYLLAEHSHTHSWIVISDKLMTDVLKSRKL